MVLLLKQSSERVWQSHPVLRRVILPTRHIRLGTILLIMLVCTIRPFTPRKVTIATCGWTRRAQNNLKGRCINHSNFACWFIKCSESKSREFRWDGESRESHPIHALSILLVWELYTMLNQDMEAMDPWDSRKRTTLFSSEMNGLGDRLIMAVTTIRPCCIKQVV